MASQWKAGYQQASFRGVEFFISSHSMKSGRRIAKHSFPNVDPLGYEDLGKKEKEFSLSAYVVDGNYFSLRDNLINALDQEGPGQLVHPYLGTILVRVPSFEVRESTKEGRVARFEITMIKEDDQPLVSIVTNTGASILASKADALDSITEDLASNPSFNLIDASLAVLENVVEALEGAIDIVQNAKKLLAPIAEFQRLISTIKGKLIQLALEAEDLSNSITELVDFGNAPDNANFPPSNPKAQFEEMVTLFGLGTENITGLPPEAFAEPNNPVVIALEQFAKTALFSASGLISEIDFLTIEEALTTRDTLFSAFDALTNNPNTSDSTISAIQELRKNIVADLDRRILDLTNAVDVVLKEDTPSLVVAYQVDGNLSNEQEIINRNGVQHPGFVDASAPVSVVVRG